MQQYQHAIEQLRDFNTSVPSSLCVGTLPVLSQYGLTPIFHRFAASHPKISLSLLEVEEPELMSGFEDGRFGISLPGNLCLQVGFSFFFVLALDTLSVMLPLTHPLAGEKEISINMISKENFILMHPYTSIHQLCLKLFGMFEDPPCILPALRIWNLSSAL